MDNIQAHISTLEGQLGCVRGALGDLERRVEEEAAEVRPVMVRRPTVGGWEQDAWDAAELPGEEAVDAIAVIEALAQYVELPEELAWIEFLVGVLKVAGLD